MSEQSRKKLELEAKQAIDDLVELMHLPAFRRYLWRYMQHCDVDGGGYIGNSETYYRQGRRDVGLRMSEEARFFAFDKWIQTLQEARAK